MKDCPYCKQSVEDAAAKCKHCGGWFENNADHKQKQVDQQAREKHIEKVVRGDKKQAVELVSDDVEYYEVSTNKLAVLSFVSFGLYELFWFYKNWAALQKHITKKISPFWRSIFSVLFCFSFFKQVNHSAVSKGYTHKKSEGMLAIFYIVILMTYRLPDPFSYISSFTFVPLMAVNNALVFNNQAVLGEHGEKSWHWGEIVLIVIGSILWVFTFLALLYPEKYTG